jgi:hypothetical protein
MWEANIKMNLNRMGKGAVSWIHLAQDITYFEHFTQFDFELQSFDLGQRAHLSYFSFSLADHSGRAV